MEDDINEPFLHYKDDENNEDIENEISQKIRGGFITKVYGILIYQLLITSLVVLFSQINSSFQNLYSHQVFFILQV